MRSGVWIAGALASAALAGGCGHEKVKNDEAMLGRLSMDQKQSVFTAEHNIEIARANQGAAQRALEAARAFRDVANKEADAARTELDAAQKSVQLGRDVKSPETIYAGRNNIHIAEKQLYAFKTKQQYARRLVDLRSEELTLAERQLAHAEAERSLARVETLHKAGIAPLEDEQKLLEQRAKLQNKIGDTERRIASIRDQVGALRTVWLERRHGYDVATRETGAAPLPIPAPPAAHQVEPEPLPLPSGSAAPEPQSAPPSAAPTHPTAPPPPPM